MIELFFTAVQDLGGRSQLPRLAATACLITAASIARAIRDFLPEMPDELIVSGGGVHNRVMMKALADQLHSVPLLTTDRIGVPSAAKEAIAFALLGAATLDGEPSNVPCVTGAKKAVVLGSITPKP
jgi:anhydro-N-acetylmuramic acid kinase